MHYIIILLFELSDDAFVLHPRAQHKAARGKWYNFLTVGRSLCAAHPPFAIQKPLFVTQPLSPQVNANIIAICCEYAYARPKNAIQPRYIPLGLLRSRIVKFQICEAFAVIYAAVMAQPMRHHFSPMPKCYGQRAALDASLWCRSAFLGGRWKQHKSSRSQPAAHCSSVGLLERACTGGCMLPLRSQSPAPCSLPSAPRYFHKM